MVGLARTPPGSYPVTALTAKILCSSHNSKLTHLDATAGEVFRLLREMQTSLDDTQPPAVARFETISGAHFEDWMLKVALGMIAANQLSGAGGTPVNAVRGDYRERLLRALFGRRPLWPPWWGLYWDTRQGEQAFAPATGDTGHAELGLEALTHPDDGALWGLRLWTRSLRFLLAFGRPDYLTAHNYRPKSLILERPDLRHEPQSLQLTWPKDGYSHKEIFLTRIGTRR